MGAMSSYNVKVVIVGVVVVGVLKFSKLVKNINDYILSYFKLPAELNKFNNIPCWLNWTEMTV